VRHLQVLVGLAVQPEGPRSFAAHDERRRGPHPLHRVAGQFRASAQTMASTHSGCRFTLVEGVVAETFGYAGGSATPSAFPKARVVTLTESGTHASIGAAIGPISGKGSGEQSLARELYPRLEEDHLLLADRNFYSFTDWCQAADTGAALLRRVTATLTPSVLQMLPTAPTARWSSRLR
jgi:hypothetical protein